jgi:hypothetical protein
MSYACYEEGHVLAPERPERLAGPEVGAFMLYHDKYRDEDRVVRVMHRSYVWAPEQHNPDGTHGYRHYDWSVIEEGPNEYRVVVVNDTDLSPLPLISHWGQEPVPMKVHVVYTLQRNVPALAPGDEE